MPISEQLKSLLKFWLKDIKRTLNVNIYNFDRLRRPAETAT